MTMRANWIVYGVLLALALAAPYLGLYPIFGMEVMCFAIFACAFNLLLGFSKMLSFGHAAYFGTAGYCAGWLMTAKGWDPAFAIMAGVALSTLLGAVIGAIAIRREGIYFAMITLALAQLVYFVFLQAPFTGGENGLQSIPRSPAFGIISTQSDLTLYYMVLAVFLCVLLFIFRVVHSPFGQVLKAIRENEPRAVSLGYKVERFKLTAFVISAALSGLAGGIKALVLGFVTLTDVSQGNSGEVILMTLVGGTGTFFGPVLGAGIVVTLQEYLSDRVGSWVSVIIGVVFVACVMAFRRGIVGEIQAFFARRARRALPQIE
jgi:branched-chain amino acid transport system permease protein